MIHQVVKPLLILLLASFVFSGCVVAERRHRRAVVYTPVPPPAPVVLEAPSPLGTTEVIVTSAPPPLRIEVVVEAPGPGYVLVPGQWVWSGRWVWEASHYVRPPRAGAVWVPHHYTHRGGVHVWVRGGWRF